MTRRDQRSLAKAFRALANPNRLAILERIQNEHLCCGTDAKRRTVCVIASELHLALSTVSHHLKELREAGLITCTRHGREVVCAIDLRMLDRLASLLKPKVPRSGAHRPKHRPG